MGKVKHILNCCLRAQNDPFTSKKSQLKALIAFFYRIKPDKDYLRKNLFTEKFNIILCSS